MDVDGVVQGITLIDSDRNRIVANNLLSAVLALARGSDRNLVRRNVLREFEGVISVHRSGYNRIVENTVWPGDDTPVSMFEAHHNLLRRNVLVTDGNANLRLTNSDDNEVTGNDLVQYGDYRDPSVHLYESSRNRFRANRLSGPPLGVWIHSGAANDFRRNRIDGAVIANFDFEDADGFRVDVAATDTALRANDVRGFEDDGIDVEAPGTLIERNAANDNGDLGIEAVAGVIDGGGNTASGNGNSLGCVNVFCR